MWGRFDALSMVYYQLSTAEVNTGGGGVDLILSMVYGTMFG